MNIRNIIENFRHAHKDLNERLDILKMHLNDEERLWDEYAKLDDTFFLNDKIINFLGDSLQQINHKEHLALYTLQDIKHLYMVLVEYYPDNIQYQEDLIAFVYNVLDDEEEALILIDKAERRMESVRRYFVKLRGEMDNK